MKRYLLAAALVALASPTLADPFLGTWSQTGKCRDDDTVMMLTPAQEHGWESHCRIATTLKSETAWVYRATCSFGDEETWSYVAHLKTSGPRLVMQVLSNSGDPNGRPGTTTYVRCRR